mgnify:CR=1 FL=1
MGNVLRLRIVRFTVLLALLTSLHLVGAPLTTAQPLHSAARTTALPIEQQALALEPISPSPSAIQSSSTITPTVSAGGSHSCTLRSDGRAICWGLDSNGQVSQTPALIFQQIEAGAAHSCGLQTNGELRCWGRNDPDGRATPPSGAFVQFSIGGAHGCAVRADGSVACWGDNSANQAPPNGPSGSFSSVSAGGLHTCGLRPSGQISCWGTGLAVTQTPGGTFKQVSAGLMHTCAIVDPSGELQCWGDPSAIGTVLSGTFKQVSAGNMHTCALRSDDTSLCWGSNLYNQVSPRPEATFSQISAGGQHSCGVVPNGVLCWGNNEQGQAEDRLAPIITLAPSSQRINAKSTLILGVQASGSPEPTYEWRYNNQPIPGATSATLKLEQVKPQQSGTYSVQVSNVMGSVSVSVDIEIVKLSQVLGFGSIETKRYGDEPFRLWASASSGLPITYTILEGKASIQNHYLSIGGAGQITVQVSQDGNEFYEAAKPITQTFLVERAPLMIVADDQVRHIDQPIPPLTASYYGLVNGDTPESLEQPPTLTTLGMLGMPAGEYPILIVGAADPNYDITMVNGVMRVVMTRVLLPFVGNDLPASELEE